MVVLSLLDVYSMNNPRWTILVVSADAAVQKLAANVLTDMQTRVVAIATVKALFEYLLQNEVSLIIFDPDIQPLSGLDAFTIAKSYHPDIPSIFLFENEQYEAAQAAVTKGVIYRMPKPIDENTLKQIFAAVCKAKSNQNSCAKNLPV